MQFKKWNLLFILIVMVFSFLSWDIADAGVYLDSAHGDAADGVHRSALGYPIGFCDHCHEQHASIGGIEPAPAGGAPSKFALFYDPVAPSQTDNFCFQCHTGAGSFQSGGNIINLTYSYRAGRWSDGVTNILQMFSPTPPGTSHNLNDISTFIAGKWSYTADSNPCNACHNPHAAQGDPIGGTTSAKTQNILNRGWPVSRPSDHSTDNVAWGLWGDDVGEKMSDYAASADGNGGQYQPPYSKNATTYEPDGSSINYGGTNLADYVTPCIDCHNITNTIYSNTLGRNLVKFDWAEEKHGGAAADKAGDWLGLTINDLIAPYDENEFNYVLACTDCHEPHGSPNSFLIREGVNGGTDKTEVTKLPTTTTDNTKQWKNLCIKCHGLLLAENLNPDGSDYSDPQNNAIHHKAAYVEFETSNPPCGFCHYPIGSDHRNCLQCHFHGNENFPAYNPQGPYPYGEKLF